MAKHSLASMSVTALIKMRDQIGAILSGRVDALQKELASIGGGHTKVGRPALNGKKHSLAGTRVAPKYRDPKSKMTWAGRGATPVWMRDAIKAGRKAEDFLIAKSNGDSAGTRGKSKKGRRKKN